MMNPMTKRLCFIPNHDSLVTNHWCIDNTDPYTMQPLKEGYTEKSFWIKFLIKIRFSDFPRADMNLGSSIVDSEMVGNSLLVSNDEIKLLKLFQRVPLIFFRVLSTCTVNILKYLKCNEHFCWLVQRIQTGYSLMDKLTWIQRVLLPRSNFLCPKNSR